MKAQYLPLCALSLVKNYCGDWLLFFLVYPAEMSVNV